MLDLVVGGAGKDLGDGGVVFLLAASLASLL